MSSNHSQTGLNNWLQHPVALCRSGFPFQFCYLCANPDDVHPSSLYCNSRNMFPPNWPSSSVKAVCLRELIFCFSVVITASSLCAWLQLVTEKRERRRGEGRVRGNENRSALKHTTSTFGPKHVV
jgi:hypothetical protein